MAVRDRGEARHPCVRSAGAGQHPPARSEDLMRRTTLLAVCLLAVTPALAQQGTTPHPLTGTSARATPSVLSGGDGSANPGTPAAARRASSRVSATGANQFTTEMTAQAHCPGGAVVWENPRSKAYHPKVDRYFGHTKVGAYLCQRDADAAGMHASGAAKGAGRRKATHPART